MVIAIRCNRSGISRAYPETDLEACGNRKLLPPLKSRLALAGLACASRRFARRRARFTCRRPSLITVMCLRDIADQQPGMRFAQVMQQPGAIASPRLLEVNGQVANLCVGIELEHRHRVHDVSTLISDVALFDFEVHQFGQLGDPLHRGLERVD